MLKKSKFWWLGESIPGNVQKGDLRRLYYIIEWQNYI